MTFLLILLALAVTYLIIKDPQDKN